MSRKEVWESDLASARARWQGSNDVADYEVYAMACAAYLTSKVFESAGEHWFCGSANTRKIAISSLIMFSFTLSDDSEDPANARYRSYEAKFTEMLSGCANCAISYQCCDADLMHELIDLAGIPEKKVLAFFKELHRKDRVRLAAQLRSTNCSVPVLTEILWSYACMTVSSFVTENLIEPKVLLANPTTVKELPPCPGLLLLSFLHSYDIRRIAMRQILKTENKAQFIEAWNSHPSKFIKMFSHGLKRNIQAEHLADFAWYTASLFLNGLAENAGILKAITDICVTEMKTARGVPRFGAHLLILYVLQQSETKKDLDLVSIHDLDAILKYSMSFKDLKYGHIDPQAPDVARSSESYKALSGNIISQCFRLYLSRIPPPSIDKIATYVDFLLGLNPSSFKTTADYDYVSQLAVKTASTYTEPRILELILGRHGSRLAKCFTKFKSHWIARLWKFQLSSTQWYSFWDETVSNSDFGVLSLSDIDNCGTAMGLLQSSKNVALHFKLPTKSQTASFTSDSSSQQSQSKSEAVVKTLLEALTDTGENEKLLHILVDKHVLQSVLLLSISGNKGLSLAAEELMKQATDEDSREALVHHLLKSHTELMLTATNSILSDAAPASTTWLAVMPGLIRLALVILDQVYSTHDGLETTDNTTVLKLLHQFWEKSWAIVANVIASIRTWTKDYAVSHVKSVLIAILEFSQGLLSKFRLLDADLSSGLSCEQAQSWGAILADPVIACVNSMGDMLQLAIPELLAMAVSIIIEILGLMHSFNVEIPDTLLSLLEGLATKQLNSRLSKDQLRELLSATNLDEEQITELLETPKHRSTSGHYPSSLPSSQSQNGISSCLSSRLSSKAQQMSIGDFFKSNGAQRPQIPARPIVNNQIVPQTPQQLSGLSMIRAQLTKQYQQQQQPGKAGVSSIAKPLGGTIGPIHPERPPGFNPQKPQQKITSSDDDNDDDDDDDDVSALYSLGAQKKREAAANKLREAYEQSKSRRNSPQIIKDSGVVSQRQMQLQRDREARAMKARLSAQPANLHREMLSWDYFAKLPPFKAKISIPDKFNDVKQYQDIMTPLLYLEAWEHMQNAKYELKKKHPAPFLLVFGKRVKVDGFTDVYVSVSKESFVNWGLGESDMLVLCYDKSKPSETVFLSEQLPHCFARIKEGTIKHFGNASKSPYVDFQIRLNDQVSFLGALHNGAMVCGYNLGSVRTVEREFTSLEALPYYDLLDAILAANPTVSEDHPDKIQQLEDNLGLNRSQAVAVSRSLVGSGFNLIQGPPGTGKTKTILGIIGAFFTLNPTVASTVGKLASPTRKILVCAPSNAAVDEIVLRLKEGVHDLNGNHQKLSILRLGRYEMVSEEVKDVTLDEMISKELNNAAEPVDDELRKDHTKLATERNVVREKLQNQESQLSPEEVRTLTDRLKELSRKIREKNYALDMQKDRLDQAKKQRDLRFRQQQNDILQKSQVVCTTLSASAHPLLANLGVTFDTVIIDEAAQCIELSALIPLKYGCKHCIMVGDPNQLPPTVISQEAGRLKYEQSLFVRMFNQYKNVEGAVSMLDTQFRMHPEISMFPSQEFYGGKLKDAKGLAEKLQRPWHRAHKALGPYTFFDVKGKHERGGSKSLKNMLEASAALALVRFIRNQFPEVGSIGVISPYKDQVTAMRQLFVQSEGANITSLVTFNSVDGFQGQEKDIIIMSCVRASDFRTDNVGFLADVRRMNVAITRAKASLWILGHSQSLVGNDVWKSLLTDASNRGRLVSAKTDIVSAIKQFDRLSPPSRPRSAIPYAEATETKSKEIQDNNNGNASERHDKKNKKRRREDSPENSSNEPSGANLTEFVNDATSVDDRMRQSDTKTPQPAVTNNSEGNGVVVNIPDGPKAHAAQNGSSTKKIRNGYAKNSSASLFIPSRKNRANRRKA